MTRERFEPGLLPGLLIIALALFLAIAAEISTCSPPTYDRNGEVIAARDCR